MILDVQLTTESYGGDCIARMPDGRALFVPFGISGEKVRVEITEEKKNYCRGKIVKVLEPSPERIQPRCPHFSDCGGCHYQQLGYADQLALKQRIVTAQLERIGKIMNPPVKPIVGGGEQWNYRNTVQFSLSANGRMGYQRAGSTTLVEIRECHLPLNAINQLWPQLEIDAQAGIQRVSIRCGENDELMLGLEGTSQEAPEFEVDFPLSVVYIHPDGNTLLSGEDYSTMRILGKPFKVSADAFFQVNTAMAEKMVSHVLTLLGDRQFEHIVDAYCGAGLFSAFLAPRCKHLTGIELSESACNDYAANLEEFEHVSLYMGKVEQVLPALEIKAELILLDPPRAGLDAKAMEGLLKAAPAEIIYVSCDPATLARDLQRLTLEGYELQSVTPFDLFPQTYHVESISLMRKVVQV
jgi:23S rRNA (uracil1939-C5)-methyltransferase